MTSVICHNLLKFEFEFISYVYYGRCAYVLLYSAENLNNCLDCINWKTWYVVFITTIDAFKLVFVCNSEF